MLPHCKTLLGSVLGKGLSVWSLQVLPTSVWVLHFPPQPKTTLVNIQSVCLTQCTDEHLDVVLRRGRVEWTKNKKQFPCTSCTRVASRPSCSKVKGLRLDGCCIKMPSPPLKRDSPSSSGCFKIDILTAGITRRHLFTIHLKLFLRRSPAATSNVANIIFSLRPSYPRYSSETMHCDIVYHWLPPLVDLVRAKPK